MNQTNWNKFIISISTDIHHQLGKINTTHLKMDTIEKKMVEVYVHQSKVLTHLRDLENVHGFLLAGDEYKAQRKQLRTLIDNNADALRKAVEGFFTKNNT